MCRYMVGMMMIVAISVDRRLRKRGASTAGTPSLYWSCPQIPSTGDCVSGHGRGIMSCALGRRERQTGHDTLDALVETYTMGMTQSWWLNFKHFSRSTVFILSVRPVDKHRLFGNKLGCVNMPSCSGGMTHSTDWLKRSSMTHTRDWQPVGWNGPEVCDYFSNVQWAT